MPNSRMNRPLAMDMHGVDHDESRTESKKRQVQSVSCTNFDESKLTLWLGAEFAVRLLNMGQPFDRIYTCYNIRAAEAQGCSHSPGPSSCLLSLRFCQAQSFSFLPRGTKILYICDGGILFQRHCASVGPSFNMPLITVQ